MTESDVVFDSWAWWEILGSTMRGNRLSRRYLRNPQVRIHTSVLAVGELAAKLRLRGDARRAEDLVPLIQSGSTLHDVSLRQCVAGAQHKADLREQNPQASLADGIMVALAQDLGAVLISADSAFRHRSGIKSA